MNATSLQQSNTSLALQPVSRMDLSVKFTDEQKRIILQTCCGGASEHDAYALVAIAEAKGLNPILGECYFVERWDGLRNRKVWAVQASIDSLRIKAEQTGLYAGQDEPEFEYDEHRNLVLVKVRVYRKDWPRPAVGVARMSEYVQTNRDGTPTRFWSKMPHNQLAKCAEALALRKAFPAVLSKLYTPEEMAQADNDNATPTAKLVEVSQPSAFPALAKRLDEAASPAEINAVAADASRALKAGTLTAGHLESLKAAAAKRRAELAQKPEVVEVEEVTS